LKGLDKMEGISLRTLGKVQQIYDFCRKYELSFRALQGNEDPINLIIETLQTMILQNEFKRATSEVDGVLYLRMDILFNDNKIMTGYFTTEEVVDIEKLDSRLSLN